jgi:vacuolar-type H+-ATPase subunit H
MAWPADLLRRFRPAGTPGAAAAAGVPVDRAAEAAGELEPILALLAGAESAAADLRERARLDALELDGQARARAAGLAAEARARAQAERADAVALACGQADAESAHLTERARRQASAAVSWPSSACPATSTGWSGWSGPPARSRRTRARRTTGEHPPTHTGPRFAPPGRQRRRRLGGRERAGQVAGTATAGGRGHAPCGRGWWAAS